MKRNTDRQGLNRSGSRNTLTLSTLDGCLVSFFKHFYLLPVSTMSLSVFCEFNLVCSKYLVSYSRLLLIAKYFSNDTFSFLKEMFLDATTGESSLSYEMMTDFVKRGIWVQLLTMPCSIISSKVDVRLKYLTFCFENHVAGVSVSEASIGIIQNIKS